MPPIADRIVKPKGITPVDPISLYTGDAAPQFIDGRPAPAPNPNPPAIFSTPGNPSRLTGLLPLQDMTPTSVSTDIPQYSPTARMSYPAYAVNTDNLAIQAQKAATAAQTTATTAATPGVALNVTAVSVSENPFKTTNNQLFSLVAVSFTKVPDPNFGYIDIWVTGYHGTATPQLVASVTTSPSAFLLETTGEKITVYFASVSKIGFANSVLSSPATQVTLNGVTTAPPFPTITQTLVSTPVGYQFTFAAEGGLLADIIDGYRIYRNTVNNSGTATIIKYIKQSAANSGGNIFQDVVNAGLVYYYWISAVNTTGLESSLVNAQSGAVSGFGGVMPPSQISPSAVNSHLCS